MIISITIFSIIIFGANVNIRKHSQQYETSQHKQQRNIPARFMTPPTKP